MVEVFKRNGTATIKTGKLTTLLPAKGRAEALASLLRAARSTKQVAGEASPQSRLAAPQPQAPRKHSVMMIRPLARSLFAFVIAALACLNLARAEDTQVWLSKSSGSLVTLAYGPVDPTKAPLFLLSCFNGMDVAVLDIHQDIAGAKPDEKLAIELSAGSAKASPDGETADANGEVFGEASDIKVKPVLAVLREKGPVTVKMGATSATLAEQGRAEAVEQFAGACTLD